ncbi:MAG: glycoside hydrolase family 16 protein [Muribaculaceae bacterium]|nr:glycoside hydrolase family 16 protein [Muribaculaceae bacterium]
MKLLLPATILFSLATLTANAADHQNGSGETDGYTLVWQDLFDADELNPLRWDIEVNGSGGGNNELQYYTDRPENVRLSDDGRGNHCLILTARRESYKGRNFTSGRVNSKGRIAFTHGKMEASIKFPSTANGLWPAFWMMGNDYDDVGWPRCGETDIIEMGHIDGINAGAQDRYFNGACHWGPAWPNASYAKHTTKSYSLQDGEFHLFTIIWDENGIKMYVDLDKHPVQNPYYKFDCPQDDPGNEWSAGNYFHKDNFILFNLAIGGNFPSIHNPEGITALNSANDNQASMYINYVRIYQKGLTSENTDFLDLGDDKSGIETVSTETKEDTIKYDGHTILSHDRNLTLYTLSGRQVAATDTGRLSTSGITPGLYLATSPSASLKVVIR